MEGFCRRIWGKWGVDKVSTIGTGLFLVRFESKLNRDQALQGHFFFDKKPVVMKPWTPDDVDLTKEEVRNVPVWIRFPKLDLKYWGEKTLFKLAGIVSMVGTPVKLDQATFNEERLMYAKVLVKIKLGQSVPSSITFVNEVGCEKVQQVEAEWMPSFCGKCKGYGHLEVVYKRKEVWVRRRRW
ncbi:Reducing polyketide synthase pksF [Bienertia sinuspersici]